jgi:hypothetical protein
MKGSIFDEIPEDEEWTEEPQSQPSANGVCLTCGDIVEDCICDEILPQYGCMQTIGVVLTDDGVRFEDDL